MLREVNAVRSAIRMARSDSALETVLAVGVLAAAFGPALWQWSQDS